MPASIRMSGRMTTPAPSLILFDIVDRNGVFSSGPDFGMSVLVRGWDSRVVITQTTGLDIVCEQNLQTHTWHRLLGSERNELAHRDELKQCVEHQNRGR